MRTVLLSGKDTYRVRHCFINISCLAKYLQSFKLYIHFVEFLFYNIQRNLQTLLTIAFPKDLICQKTK